MTRYTPEEQLDSIKRDLVIDIDCAEEQATNGPYYPERGITRDSLLAYAHKCRLDLERLSHNTNTLSAVNAFINGKE